MKARVEFKPQDLWVGAFWKHSWSGGDFLRYGYHPHMRVTDLWICVVPMLPIHLTWGGGR